MGIYDLSVGVWLAWLAIGLLAGLGASAGWWIVSWLVGQGELGLQEPFILDIAPAGPCGEVESAILVLPPDVSQAECAAILQAIETLGEAWQGQIALPAGSRVEVRWRAQTGPRATAAPAPRAGDGMADRPK